MSQNCGSSYCFFSRGSLFLLTPAEKMVFSQLNAVIFAEVNKKKKNRLKRTSKKKRNFETCKPDNCKLNWHNNKVAHYKV